MDVTAWIDPPARRIGMEEWRSLFSRIPPEVRASFRYLEGTPYETAYLDEPACFAEEEGDVRLRSLLYDNSLASLRLWSYLLSEEQRLHRSRKAGKKIVGALKDLGTVPVMVYSTDDAVAFYPDGAWWIPCIMEHSDGLFRIADSLGVGEEVCPARSALAALLKGTHFPVPDLLVAAVGACCDDFSAVMQHIEDLGVPMRWWELPFRRDGFSGDEGPFEVLPTGRCVPSRLVDFVARELEGVREALEALLGVRLTDAVLERGIAAANELRSVLAEIRDLAYGSVPCPLPALEAQICEMFALHFCSGRDEAVSVLEHVRDTVKARVERGEGVLPADACRVVWVNPVADLKVMNLFEDLGGAVAGTEYLFRHALVGIPEDVEPLRALALTALCDPMIGTAASRAELVAEEVRRYGAEGVVVCRIPGASHCASEGEVIREVVSRTAGVPVLEVTVPSVIDPVAARLAVRFEAFFETIRERRAERP